EGGDMVRQTAVERLLAGRILTEAGRYHVAHDAFVDDFGIDAGAADGLADDHGAELGGAEALEHAEKFPRGRAHGADDDRFTHRLTSDLDARDGIVAEQRFQTREDDGARSIDLARPLRARRIDHQYAAFEPDRRRALERGTDGRAPRERDFAVRQRRAAQQMGERSRHGM